MHNAFGNNLGENKAVYPKRLIPLRFIKSLSKDYQLYLLLLPAVLYIVIFKYVPMYGVQLAFKKYYASRGIWGSPWIGFENFERFFTSYAFWRVIKNTVGINLYELLVSFPAPIMLALLLNHVKSNKFKRIVQTVTYAPHFISTVVMVGMLYIFLSPRNGIINQIVLLFTDKPIFFLGSSEWFKTIYVFSGIWQHAGWSAIVYLAALTSIDTGLYDAAYIDGCNRFQVVRHVDLPGITPVVVIMLILDLGKMMQVGFQKIFLMQNDLNLQASEVISTYVYKIGLISGQFSYSTAVNLFNTIVNILLLVTANNLAKRVTDNSLW